jgi:hypothetical protein
VTWQWIVLVLVVAIYALCVQAIHAWKEVRMIQQMPPDVLKDMQEHQSKLSLRR